MQLSGENMYVSLNTYTDVHQGSTVTLVLWVKHVYCMLSTYHALLILRNCLTTKRRTSTGWIWSAAVTRPLGDADRSIFWSAYWSTDLVDEKLRKRTDAGPVPWWV